MSWILLRSTYLVRKLLRVYTLKVETTVPCTTVTIRPVGHPFPLSDSPSTSQVGVGLEGGKEQGAES